MKNSKPLFLKIQSRDGDIYEGQVLSLSSKNDKGKFDILEQHANFISLINDVLVIRELNGQTKEIPVTNGVLKVEDGKVDVYSGVKA